MRPGDQALYNTIEQALLDFHNNLHPLPGIVNAANLDCFVEQIIDSVRRIKYITTLKGKPLAQFYTDPQNLYFDPVKAAIWYQRNGNDDEAFWLTFLQTHFGKNKNSKWSLVKNLYGSLGNPPNWTWQRICANPNQFKQWLQANQVQLKATGNFGNHRKYQSLDALKPAGTGNALISYVNWIGAPFSHLQKINTIQAQVGNTPTDLFNGLYNSMDDVVSFGRTAKFDYLSMVGKLDLANVLPGSTYMHGSTGPISGARLLFGNLSIDQLEPLLNQLNTHLNLYFGMQVLEDALCNWQKSPGQYRYFGG